MFGDWHITEAMIVYGGSFVQQLGRLYRLADTSNKWKLRRAFPEYFEQYEEMARKLETQLESGG